MEDFTKKIKFLVISMSIPAVLLLNAAFDAFNYSWRALFYVWFCMIFMLGHNMFIVNKDDWSSRAKRLACAHADASIGFIGCAVLMFFGDVYLMSMFLFPMIYFSAISALVVAYAIWKISELFDANAADSDDEDDDD